MKLATELVENNGAGQQNTCLASCFPPVKGSKKLPPSSDKLTPTPPVVVVATPPPAPQNQTTTSVVDRPLASLLVDNQEFETFNNALPPNRVLLHERPEHRMLLMLKVRGLTNKEIALETGWCEVTLSQLFRQPWAQDFMVKFFRENGGAAIHSILKAEQVPSLMVLKELRDNKEVAPAVRKACADSLLDRYLGKPKQAVEFKEVSDNPDDPKTPDELDAEILRLQQEMDHMRGIGAVST